MFLLPESKLKFLVLPKRTQVHQNAISAHSAMYSLGPFFEKLLKVTKKNILPDTHNAVDGGS